MLDWEDTINTRDGGGTIVDRAWLEGKEVQEPTDWHPAKDLITYLTVLFDPSEYVGYVTETFKGEDGRQVPSKGNYDRTAGQLIDALRTCKDDIGAVLGDSDPDVGAWIRFNPLDGKGVKNENVTAFRYALVESDEMNLEEQHAMIRELELPVAALVSSGGKSIHAIVRIEAGSFEEYRSRADCLYAVCEKNGLKVDRQNRNPSRLSRLPGVMRRGKKQFLLASNMRSSQITLANKLGIIISTQYPNDNNVLTDEIDIAKKVLDRVLDRENVFSLLYEPDDALRKQWETNDLVLYQANPVAVNNAGVLRAIKDLRSMAVLYENKRENFLCKHCNIMYKGLGVEGYIDTQKVMQCRRREDLSFWSGRRVWVGLDLAQSDDNTVVSMVTVEGDMLYAIQVL